VNAHIRSASAMETTPGTQLARFPNRNARSSANRRLGKNPAMKKVKA
jgi:hypothetical protein